MRPMVGIKRQSFLLLLAERVATVFYSSDILTCVTERRLVSKNSAKSEMQPIKAIAYLTVLTGSGQRERQLDLETLHNRGYLISFM
jgi:hypothetical protein